MYTLEEFEVFEKVLKYAFEDLRSYGYGEIEARMGYVEEEVEDLLRRLHASNSLNQNIYSSLSMEDLAILRASCVEVLYGINVENLEEKLEINRDEVVKLKERLTDETADWYSKIMEAQAQRQNTNRGNDR